MKIGLFALLFLTFSQTFAQQSQSFAQYQRIDNMKHQIHVLEIDPTKHKIVLIKEDPHMRKSVSALVKQYKAYAGINGGFFHETGVPAGALKVNGKWMGSSKQTRGAIGWNEKDNLVLVDRIVTKAEAKKKIIILLLFLLN